jgi:hypothetical protein
MIGKLKDLLRLSGGEWLVSFTTRENPGRLFDKLRNIAVMIDIKKYEQDRSIEANRFCWAMCTDIGKAMTPPVSKEEVYRMAIRAVGVYTDAKLCLWDIEKAKSRWSEHGTGWFIEVMDDAEPGWKYVHMYYGSSTYTVGEMRILLDWLVDQMEQMELPIRMSKEDEERALAQWHKASCKKAECALSAAV